MPEILSLGAPEATSTKNKRIQYKLKQQQQNQHVIHLLKALVILIVCWQSLM